MAVVMGSPISMFFSAVTYNVLAGVRTGPVLGCVLVELPTTDIATADIVQWSSWTGSVSVSPTCKLVLDWSQCLCDWTFLSILWRGCTVTLFPAC